MTETLNVPNPLIVVTRVDQKWANRTADEPAPPEYLRAMSTAVQQQIVDPLAAGGTAAPFELVELEGECATLRARIAELDAEALAAHAAAAAAVDAARAEVAELPGEVKRLTHEVGRLNALLLDKDVERVATNTRLTELQEKLDATAVELADAYAANAALLEETATHEPAAHQHAYVWPDTGTAPLPCSCGHKYPRTTMRRPVDNRPPTREPFEELFGAIRAQLTGVAGWSA